MMISQFKNFYQKHIGPGGGDYNREPGKLQAVAEEIPGAAVGAGLGAAAGALVGYGLGYHSLANDNVQIVTQRTEFLRPELVGARYIPESCTTNYTYDGDGNISGSYQTCDSPYFRPLVENRSTGLIEERQKFTHTSSIGPLGGAAIGLGIGTVAGAIVGALAQKFADPRAAAQAHDRGDKAPLIGLGVGALLGAGAGYAAGSLAQSKAQTLTEVVRTPVTVKAGIGWVPHARDYYDLRPQMDRYQLNYTDTNRFSGKVQVVRDVPTGEFHAHTEISQSHRLTPLGGAALGLGIGAVAGGLAGVAVGVLDKLIAS